MKVPSYDDLAPSIPDVHPRDTFDQVTRLVTAPQEPVVRVADARVLTAESCGGPAPLFACLRAVPPAAPAALFALARDFSPRIERHDDTCIVLDVAGLGRLLGDAHGIAAELHRTASERGIKTRIAVAPTQTAALLMTLGPTDPAVAGDDVARVLAPLPLRALEQHAARGEFARAVEKVFDTLRRWGLRAVGELAALPADEIAARFGQRGVALQRLARGIDATPLLPDPCVPRFVQSMELEWPIEELEPLSFVLARLLEPLSLSLERADKAAAAIRLDLRLVDRSTHTRQLQLPAAMRDPRVLRTLLLLDLESHAPAAGIDVVTIEADPAPARIVQFSLLERAVPSPETLATLTARLGALVGDTRCGSPVLLDSHRPDAFAMERFDPAGASATFRRTRPGLEGEPPNVRGIVLRRFRPPVAIRVAVERGRPLHIPIDRKGMPGGRVQQAAGPWRSSGGWWDTGDTRWDRDEWDVALADGSVCRIFQERENGRWFVEGVID